MSERLEIFDDSPRVPRIRIVAPNGFEMSVIPHPIGTRVEDSAYHAIRQLLSDNAALLAANRDNYLHFEAIKADYDAMKLRAEQAESRLAEIDAAPTVGVICIDNEFAYIERTLKLPPIGTELIARPARERA